LLQRRGLDIRKERAPQIEQFTVGTVRTLSELVQEPTGLDEQRVKLASFNKSVQNCYLEMQQATSAVAQHAEQ